jgi:hypothetical protein
MLSKILFFLTVATFGFGFPSLVFAEISQPTGTHFTLVSINMNGVPDLLRLPDVSNRSAGEIVDVSIGDKRWEENFYVVIEGATDLPWKVEQRQINCLVDPADSTLLKSWPNRVTEWRTLSFVGTNRYKGNLFLEQDLTRLTRDELEAHARKSSGSELGKNLQIVNRLIDKPEGNSYNCRNEIRVSLAKAVAGQAPVNVTFNIAVDNF